MADTKESGIVWRKSKASESGSCVEVALVGDHALMRDSKNREGPVLQFSMSEWKKFLNWANKSSQVD